MQRRLVALGLLILLAVIGLAVAASGPLAPASDSELRPAAVESGGAVDHGGGAPATGISPPPSVDDPQTATTVPGNESMWYAVIARSDTRPDRSALEAYGPVDTVTDSRAEVSLTPSEVASVRALPWVARVELIRPVDPAASVDQTAAAFNVSSLGPARAHATGITGANVTVGVIDTGFDPDRAPYADQVASTRSFRPDDLATTPAHGSAVAEIVAETAPGADLHLVAVETATDIDAAVSYLREQQTDVITMSLTTPVAPHDGTGYVSRQARAAVEQGIHFVAPTGNYAQRHWNNTFDGGADGQIHTFPDGSQQNCLSGCRDAVSGSFTITLTWDDWSAAERSDYNLYLYDRETNNYIAQSRTIQLAESTPAERLTLRLSSYRSLSVVVTQAHADRAHDLELFIDGVSYGFARGDPASSITATATANPVVAVGAAGFDSRDLEPYSAQGPTNDGRLGIDLLAPAGMATSSYASFRGTSASAPYTAGTLALMIDANRSITPSGAETVLRRTATDLDPPGPDLPTGAGHLDEVAALRTIVDPTPLSITANRTTVAPGSTVAFRVRDPEGAPISDAIVATTVGTVSTDATGVATLRFERTGRYEITASKTGDIRSYRNATTTVTVRTTSTPLGPTAAAFDANADGDISVTELGAAGRAFAGGELTIVELGAVGRAFAQ